MPTFWVSLSYFKLVRMAEVEPQGSRKERLDIPAAGLGAEGPLPKCKPTPAPAAGALSLAWPGAAHHLSSSRRCGRRWRPRTATRREHPLPYPRGLCLLCRGCARLGSKPGRAARVPDLPRPSCLTVAPVSPPGALLPGRRSETLPCSLPPARSAMVWQCVWRSPPCAPACCSCTAASEARRSGPRSSNSSRQRRPSARGARRRAAPRRARRPPRDRGHWTDTSAWWTTR